MPEGQFDELARTLQRAADQVMVLAESERLPQGLLSTDRVAGMVGRSPRQVRRYAEEGHLKGVKIGRSWLFEREEVQRLLLEGGGPAGYRR